ncbi:hypothetical protein ACFSHQ_27945 [Gemmobacter lanyuensis]
MTGTVQAAVLACVTLDAAPTTTTAISVRDKADARRADVMRLMAVGRLITARPPDIAHRRSCRTAGRGRKAGRG